MVYQAIADLTMATHFAFLAYVLAGGFLAWRWPWAFWPHLVLVAWGFSTILLYFDCPLTYLEDWARHKAGERGLATGFIDHYLTGVVYPEQYAGLLQVLTAGTIAVSWAGALVLWRRRRRQLAASS